MCVPMDHSRPLPPGMWSIYMESLESYRSGMYTFTRGFLTAMLADRRAQCPTVPLPHLLFLTMPSTTLHEGLRSRARIDLWNRAAIDAIHDVIVELRRLHSEPLLHIDILDYFAPTDLRPERSDGNHFGDWMQGVAVPVLSKANVNALLNRVCYS